MPILTATPRCSDYVSAKSRYRRPPAAPPSLSLPGNNSSQRLVAGRRDAIGAAVSLLFDPAFRLHARDDLLAGRMQPFRRKAPGEAHPLQRGAFGGMRNVTRPRWHSFFL